MEWLLGGYIWLFVHRPFEIWPALGAIQLERAYMILCILAWVFYPKKAWNRNRLSGAFLVLTAAILVSWLMSPFAELGTETVENQLKFLVFYVLLITTVTDERALKRVLAIYLCSVSLYMLHSVYEFMHGRQQFRMGIPRLTGVAISNADPNTFAATLLYSLPLALPFWPGSQLFGARGLLLGYQALTMFCIVKSGSRGAFVGLLCYIFILTICSPRRIQLFFLLFILAPAVLICIPGPLQNRFLTIIKPEVGPANAQESAQGRWHGLVNGLRMWSERPMTGYGPNAFGTVVGNGLQAHNLVGQTVGELGTPGALGVLLLVGMFWLNGREARRLRGVLPEDTGDFAHRTIRAIGVAVILLLIVGAVSHNLYRFTWIWFGAFQAIALYCLRSACEAEPEWGAEYAWDLRVAS